jgi:ribosomal protein S18 acetylase RimI-like enzyme
MTYLLKMASNNKKGFIYNVKKASNYHFVQEIWGWNEDYQIKDFETDYREDNFKIIETNNKDIGFLQLEENENNVNITEIHIIPEYQGCGIGSSIITDIVKQAVDKHKTVTIVCFIQNTPARNLYERLGFKITSITETHYEMVYSIE